MNNTSTTNGTTYQTQEMIIDTGTSTNHTINITNLSTRTIYINYFYFFDQDDMSCNPVFVMEPELLNWGSVGQVSATQNQGSLTRSNIWYMCLKRLVYRFRVYYGLHVYFIDNTFPNILGTCARNQIYPNKQWHERIADRIYDFIITGELAYELL
jgi:hypothetical protein